MKWNLISHNHRYAHYTPISSRVSFPPLPLQAPPKPSVSSPYIYPRFLCRHPSPQFSSTPLSCLQFSSHPCHPMPSVRLRALDPPVFTPAHIPPPPHALDASSAHSTSLPNPLPLLRLLVILIGLPSPPEPVSSFTSALVLVRLGVAPVSSSFRFPTLDFWASRLDFRVGVFGAVPESRLCAEE